MSDWHLARSLVVLLSEINTRAPLRDKSSDGSIADERHVQEGKSDHIQNWRGVVCAIDVTHDPSHCDGSWLAETLRVSKDVRIKYVIWHGRIFSSLVQPWVWRTYTGENQHNHHVHISVRDDVDDVQWSLNG